MLDGEEEKFRLSGGFERKWFDEDPRCQRAGDERERGRQKEELGLLEVCLRL